MPRGELLHGLNPLGRLEACIDDINRHHGDAELCVVTGDLAHHAQPKAYADLRECLSRLRMPTHLVVGNHDRAIDCWRRSPRRPSTATVRASGVETSAGWFLMLDTVRAGEGLGQLLRPTPGLAAQVARGCSRPARLPVHAPSAVPRRDSQPGNRLGLGADGDRIGEVLSAHDNVRHLFFGHVHRPIAGSWRGIPCSTLRGTNHQVPLDFDAVEVVPKSHEPPAYAVVFLEDGQTTVHFSRLPRYLSGPLRQEERRPARLGDDAPSTRRSRTAPRGPTGINAAGVLSVKYACAPRLAFASKPAFPR